MGWRLAYRIAFQIENSRNKAKMTTVADQAYDRLKEIQQFEDSKLGVKGLVDSGITSIPRFFIHPPETLSDLKPTTPLQPTTITIPTIDISDQRSKVVELVALACREFGFFQVVNHGIPQEVLDRIIRAVKGFHEQPATEKARWYCRELGSGVSFSSNYDLFHSKAACWIDSLLIRTGPTLPELEKFPDICIKEVIEWDQKIKSVGMLLMEILCEGLGLEAKKLEKMTCLEGRAVAGHYYPSCPQPNLTFGSECHTDPSVLTMLLQDHVGGLQVKCGNDRQWVDVQPLPGALVVNIGDILQMMSNGEYRSVEHRVLANSSQEPRISVAVFFNPSDMIRLCGPFAELISPETPPLYKQFTLADFMQKFLSKEVDGKYMTNYYKY